MQWEAVHCACQNVVLKMQWEEVHCAGQNVVLKMQWDEVHCACKNVVKCSGRRCIVLVKILY